MLQAPKTLATSALIPFVPRQVMLDSKASAAIESKIKEKEMEKESKKKKKSKSSKQSETLENGSIDPKTVSKGKNRQMLLSSIAGFLESNGFHKTLAVFRSETQIAGDGRKAASINFEDLFYKFLEPRSPEEAAINCQKENDSQKADDSSKDEIEHAHDASEHIHKKKRKHKKELDDGMNLSAAEHGSGSDKNINGSNLEKLKSAEDLHVGIKEKKKKKSLSDSLEESADKDNLEISCGVTKETDKNDKSKKKKKHKMSSDGGDENTGPEDQKEKLQEIVEEKIAELKSLTNMSSSLSAESNAKHKGEKKKKKKKKTETSDSLAVNGNNSTEEALKESDSVKEKTAASENGDGIEKKAHKKRKRLDSEEKTSQDENATTAKDCKHVKLEDAENNKEWEAPHKPDKSLPDSEQTTNSKKRKTEKSNKNSNEADKTSHQEEDPSSQDVQKEQLANGKLEKSEKEGGTASKSQKKEKCSAEPKTVNAFQRVKIDEVKFADERLQDNSYWALDDSGSGYGAKAQEVLGQVRGRDFRHEKTKKKRGTYRGGQIDLQSHSIKFNYSEEE